MCEEDSSLTLNDGRHAIFFNAKAYFKEKDSVRKNFLAFVNGEEIHDAKIEIFAKQINDIKTNKEWKIDYMNLALKFSDMHNLGYEEGEKVGAHNKAIEAAKNAIAMGLDSETIAKITGLSEEEIIKLIK